MSTKLILHLAESDVTINNTVLPTPTAVTATALFNAVQFVWHPEIDIRPFHWQIRSRFEGGAWDNNWSAGAGKTIANNFTRELTVGELAGAITGNIELQLRAIDGEGNVTPVAAPNYVTANANCVLATIITVTDPLMASNLDITVTDRLFSTSAKLGSELQAGSLPAAQIVPASLTPTQLATASTDRMFTSSGQKTTVVNGAADGVTAQAKLAAEVGAETIATQVYAATVGPISAAEKIKLETALDTTVAAFVAGDTILIAKDGVGGGAENLGVVKTQIKTALLLEQVANYTPANQVLNGLSNSNLVSNTTAVISGNATKNQQVIAAVNASSEATKIANAALQTVMPAILGYSAAGDMFDSSGRLKTGIAGSSGNRTSDQISQAINSSANCVRLDISGTNIKAGTLNDIPVTGTARWVTVNEKTGAANGYAGLSASGEITVGTGTNNVSAIDAACARHRMQGCQIKQGDGITALDSCTFTEAGIGSPVVVLYLPVERGTGENFVVFKCLYLASSVAGAPVIAGTLITLNYAAIGSVVPVSQILDVATPTWGECELKISFVSATPVDGTTILKISMEQEAAESLVYRGYRWYTYA